MVKSKRGIVARSGVDHPKSWNQEGIMNFNKRALYRSVSAITMLGMAATAQAQVDDDEEFEEIVVTGIKSSLRQAIQTKRDSDALIDAINAEDIGKFPDKNVAEALQRVPGIVINREFGEGERVALRGTAPSLTRTLFNGAAVATADWFILEQLSATRAFNYLTLPSEIVGQLQVYKSPTADLDEGGLGGSIDVITRKPLDQADSFSINASLSGVYSELSEELNPQASGFVGWKNDDDTFGIILGGIYQERNIRRDGIEVLGYFETNKAPGLQVPSLIGSALFQQERRREGGNIAIQYQPDDSLEINLTGLYSRFDADNFNQNYLAWFTNALGGDSELIDTVVEGDTVVAGTVTRPTQGFGAVFDAIDRDAVSDTYVVDFDTVYRPNDDWELHFKVGYTAAQGDTTNQPFFEAQTQTGFTFDLRGRAPEVNFLDIDPRDPAALDVFGFASLHEVTNDDDEFYVFADAERFVDLGPLKSIKVGGKYTEHNRETRFNISLFGNFFLNLLNGGCNGGPCSTPFFAGDQLPSNFAENIAAPGSLTEYVQIDRQVLRDTFFSQPAANRERISFIGNNFDVTEQVYAGYIKGDLEGDNWRGNVGVRVVHTEQSSTGELTGVGGSQTSLLGNFDFVTVDRSYTDVLPSLNLSYDLRDDLVLRLAAARTIARADFTQLAPQTALNPGALSGNGGNPDIDPFRADQFDISIEWYPNPDEYLAIAFYYKDVQSFIINQTLQEVQQVETSTPSLERCESANNPNNPALFNCLFDVTRPVNGTGGRIQGIEVSGLKQLGYGFGLQANYTYTDSNIPGSSEHVANASLFYEDENWSARAAYNYRSDFFINIDRGSELNQKAFGSLDASISYQLTDGISLTLDAINLTNEKIEQFAGEEFRPRAIFDNGRTFFFGARFKY